MSIQEKLLAIDTQDRVRGIIVTVKGTINCIWISFNNLSYLIFKKLKDHNSKVLKIQEPINMIFDQDILLLG